MEKLRTFLASSWDTKDKTVTDYFESLLGNPAYGLEVRSVKDRRAEKVQEKIYREIDGSDIVIGLFTRDSFDDIKKTYKPPVWVVSEINYALGRQKLTGKPKKILIFRDEQVPREEGTFIALEGYDIVPFNIQNLDANKQQYDQFLRDIHKIRDIHPELSYKINNMTWIATVFLNGNGILRHKYSVLILDQEKFKGVRHSIFLNIELEAEEKFPTLSTLRKSSLQERFTKPFFTARFIKASQVPFIDEMGWDIKTLQSTPKTRNFFIQFPLKFKTNDIFEYEWAWGYPHLFPANSNELKMKRFSGKNDKNYAETYIDLKYAEVSNLTIQVNFERGLKFNKIPFLGSSVSPEEEPAVITTFSEVKRSVFYDSYISDTIKNPYGTYMCRWIPK